MYENIIKVLNGFGYKQSFNETILNKEYKEVSRFISVDEDLSTFGCIHYIEEYNFDLCLNKSFFSNDKVKDIISNIRNLGVSIIETNIDNEENEFIISIYINIR